MSFILNLFWGLLKSLGLVNKEAKIVFLGLDNAGKTTLLHVLKRQHLKQPNPTFHPTMEELIIEGITFSAWDLGGHLQARKIWRDYFPVIDAIVFVVDSSDPERFPDAKEELQNLLENKDLSKIPFVVLGNKVDNPRAVSEDELLTALGLHNVVTGKGCSSLIDIRPVETFMCSIVNREGYIDGFKWLSQFIK